MYKNVVLAVIFVALAGVSAYGQVCPLNGTSSHKLVCLIPQVYGPFGLGFGASNQSAPQSVLFTGDRHAAHFNSDFLSTFAPINEAVGIQVSELPLASPSSGINFIYDTNLKTFTPSTDESLGPILGDRASTIGRRRLFAGFSYQYFNFSRIDGQDLNHIPTVLEHQPLAANGTFLLPCANSTALAGTKYNGDPCFVRDFIQTSNHIDLKVHQYTIYLTYGITQHLDFSAAIPILNVQMKVTSSATIVPNSVAPTTTKAPGDVWHSFNPSNPALASQCATASSANQACLNAVFSNGSSASGLGDVILRGKYTVHQWEKLGLAAGLDVRLPTGDELNFLGSGTFGFKPFGVVSYNARVSPHAEIGYEINGDSTLAGDNIVTPSAGTTVKNKNSLPNRFLYIVGADARFTKRITGAFDIYGQRLFSAPQLVSQPYTDYGKCSGPAIDTSSCPTYTAGTTHPNIAQRTADLNITDASLGVKVRLFQHLVATGNLLLKLDNGGLRARAVPLVGLSYSF